ncbi:MAG TPA: DUF4157 domain-containing protein, partial [Polyangiales bacterium]|nr:DUF4157 domain-containing protein [Polyangiales bacterium]
MTTFDGRAPQAKSPSPHAAKRVEATYARGAADERSVADERSDAPEVAVELMRGTHASRPDFSAIRAVGTASSDAAVQRPAFTDLLDRLAEPAAVDRAEEARARAAVTRLTAAPAERARFMGLLGDRSLRSGALPEDVRALLAAHVGALPCDLSLRVGPDVDRALLARRARGLASGRELWVGGPSLAPGAGGFAATLAHEAAHVATGGSHAARPPCSALDEPIESHWYAAERARRAELEAAETGPGRKATLARIHAFNDDEARRHAPGIAYRAQDRDDLELAQVAAQRLLDAWLALRIEPKSFDRHFGEDDATDTLLDRVEQAFASGASTLGGKYLAVVMVQLVRAADVAVRRRPPPMDDQVASALRDNILLPLVRDHETAILSRLQRARELLDREGRAVAAQGDRAEL